ncbi:MAG: hypothetical protein VB858_18605, partial [Planctomycetaceae bacterium]
MPSRITRVTCSGVGLMLFLSHIATAQTTAQTAPGPRPGQSAAARVLQYRTESGESYQAVLLAPARATIRTTAHDHVVLFDTSASQVGAHRQQALTVLDGFIAALPQTDRVRLFAIDVKPNELTTGFGTSTSENLTAARKQLGRRAPLGATDLNAALGLALKVARDSASASVVYIGDGVSGSRLIQSSEMQAIVDGYRTARVPVNSFAIGPRKDLRVMGVLANWTGGAVLLDEVQDKAAPAGIRLSRASRAQVFFPDQVDVGQAHVFPNVALPVRSDRETVYLSKGEAPTLVTLSNDRTQVSWQTSAPDTDSSHAYLAPLVQRAEHEPISTPLAGEAFLAIAQSEFNQRVAQLTELGDVALLDRDLKRAQQVGKALRRLNPDNNQAARLLKVSFQPPGAGTGTADPFTQGQQGSAIDDLENLGEIKGQRLQLQVSQAIQLSRVVMEEDPDGALTILKRALATTNAAADVNPDLRINLGKRLTGVIADVKGQKEVRQMKELRAQERSAAVEAQSRLLEQIQLEDDRMERLIDRVRALLADAEKGNPAAYLEAEAVAEQAIQLRPGDGIATAARFGSEAAGQLYTAYYLRNLRADRFLDVLEQVERSHVPFPDEPPVRWPAPEVWKALTERRKQWSSVDLHEPSTNERKIISALDDQTTINFIDTPLIDCIQFIAQQHEIPIIIEQLALDDAGIPSDEPLNLVLSGITLRSALKILLQDLQLTYVIEDEVMKITTVDLANERLSTRVYPVGDLVVQLNAQGLGGQGSGGLGGQQLGGGGGQQGGGFGGGGQQGG